ncbi:MAG TPA: peroxiredoxin [Candidatus Binatia bacterium]|jgi:alkyl hydroperoxide reductase subunit AhpC|nr:peroxiredoxin [Candidatus Binatia bacterium]
MSQLRIGDNAPDFKVKGVLRGQVTDYSLSSYKGKWSILFFYPADFTFICPTEVTGFSKLAKEFSTENAAILGASVDSIDTHRSWAEELGGLEYPLLSDESKNLSRAYGVLDEKEGVSLRATFIINPAGVICYQVVSHVNVGRNVEETLRVLKALRTERLCPSDWKPGEPTGDLGLKY